MLVNTFDLVNKFDVSTGGFQAAWVKFNESTGIMKKNVASQSVGVQMITAADGSDFTGAVSVAITIDNGTKAAGSGTAPAHEGTGYHSYTPTQAETNGDHIALTFTGTGAITATLQVYTSFPQTVDNDTRLAANNTLLQDIPTVAEFNARTLTAANYFDPTADAVANVTLVATTTTNTDMRGTDSANTATPLSAAGFRSALGLASANMDVQFTASVTATGFATSGALATVDSNVDAILIDTGTTLDTKLNDIQGLTFATSTDSLEAIRDRGDTAWVTGAGGSSPTVTQIRQEMDSNSTQLAAIIADTNELQLDWVNGGRLDLLLDAIPTTAMRGTDSAALATALTTAQNDLNIITGATGVNLLTATQASIDAIETDTATTIPALIAALNNISAAQVNTEVDTAISDAALATAAALATVDTVADAIKVVTDKFLFTVANQVDSNIQSINDVTITGDGSATPFDV